MALCRRVYGTSGPVVFGWVFASHQVAAAIAAALAGLARDQLGNYDAAWYAAGGLCVAAAAMCLSLRQTPGAALILESA